jgi:hypothetical protein
MKRGLAVLALFCIVVGLTACTPQGAENASGSPVPVSTQGGAATPPAYLDRVDSNGLIDGKNLAQLTGEMIFACMQEAGWSNLILDADGSISGHVPVEQSAKYDADQAACQAKAAKAYPPAPMSERAIRERYALEVQTRECLIGQGYDISEPPSEQTWVEQFSNSSKGLWLPYWEIFIQSKLNAGAVAALKVKCPDPGERFYRQ